ncbi:MAG: iron-containing alcohol dehydrogenase [Clostridia bacterium]|nr:iron-containing alcohol dehydrogenase [Clostridia bacterium]
MRQLVLKTNIQKYRTAREFVSELKIGAEDLVVTNKRMYKDIFGGSEEKPQGLFREDFGGGEPTDVMVEGLLQKVSGMEFGRIIGIGGGAVMDITKILAVECGKPLQWMYDNKESLKKRAPMILVPTTCGTGSEVTNIGVVNFLSKGQKIGLVSDEMFADTAALCPALLDGMPYSVFATSSIDALIHAIESVLSPGATDYTRIFGYQAMDMIIYGYSMAQQEGGKISNGLWDIFLTASNFAGISFGTAGNGAVHAMSFPLGGKYHIPHGESCYLVLDAVLKYYRENNAKAELNMLEHTLAELFHCPEETAFEELDHFLAGVYPRKRLHEYGITHDDIAEFVSNVISTQQRLLKNSYVPVDEETVRRLYESVY